jgi:uridine phosphorylase
MHRGLLRRFGWRYPSRRVHGFLGELHVLKRSGSVTAVLGNFGIGAPVTVALAEEMLALGARRLILLGSAGSLEPDLGLGQVMLCERALRDEGTSYHYLPPAASVPAAPRLTADLSSALSRAGLPHHIGTTWSTDAPYRESAAELEYVRGLGARTVDMECAGLFALGAARAIETAAILVTSDSLSAQGWSAPAGPRPLEERLEAVLRVLVRL